MTGGWETSTQIDVRYGNGVCGCVGIGERDGVGHGGRGLRMLVECFDASGGLVVVVREAGVWEGRALVAEFQYKRECRTSNMQIYNWSRRRGIN